MNLYILIYHHSGGESSPLPMWSENEPTRSEALARIRSVWGDDYDVDDDDDEWVQIDGPFNSEAQGSVNSGGECTHYFETVWISAFDFSYPNTLPPEVRKCVDCGKEQE